MGSIVSLKSKATFTRIKHQKIPLIKSLIYFRNPSAHTFLSGEQIQSLPSEQLSFTYKNTHLIYIALLDNIYDNANEMNLAGPFLLIDRSDPIRVNKLLRYFQMQLHFFFGSLYSIPECPRRILQESVVR